MRFSVPPSQALNVKIELPGVHLLWQNVPKVRKLCLGDKRYVRYVFSHEPLWQNPLSGSPAAKSVKRRGRHSEPYIS